VVNIDLVIGFGIGAIAFIIAFIIGYIVTTILLQRQHRRQIAKLMLNAEYGKRLRMAHPVYLYPHGGIPCQRPGCTERHFPGDIVTHQAERVGE